MTYHRDWLREFPYWTFDDAVSTPVDEFPDEWREYWGIGAPEPPEYLNTEEWEIANEMHDVARRIAHSAADLQGRRLPDNLRTLPAFLAEEARAERMSRDELVQTLERGLESGELKGGPWEDLVQFMRWTQGEAEARSKLFHTALQIYAYPDFGLPPGRVATRLLELLEFLMRTRGDRSREYLRRVAMCYIRDMRPEMAVMSRAVMEAALAIDEVAVRVEANLQVQGVGKRHPGLGDWIQAACDVGVLDEEGRLAADSVKEAGDHAIHNVPQQAPEARVVLESLRTVLLEVERFEKGGA